MPRRTWLDSKIDVFLEELAASGMHLDRHRAGELITGQVRAVAALMRVTEATAAGRPVEWRRTLIRGDRFSLLAEFSSRTGYRLVPGNTYPVPRALAGSAVRTS